MHIFSTSSSFLYCRWFDGTRSLLVHRSLKQVWCNTFHTDVKNPGPSIELNLAAWLQRSKKHPPTHSFQEEVFNPANIKEVTSQMGRKSNFLRFFFFFSLSGCPYLLRSRWCLSMLLKCPLNSLSSAAALRARLIIWNIWCFDGTLSLPNLWFSKGQYGSERCGHKLFSVLSMHFIFYFALVLVSCGSRTQGDLFWKKKLTNWNICNIMLVL